VDINLIILIVLVFLAVIDLTVGVANDAVNFLNAAVGSKAGKLKTVLIVAAFGVLVGVLFSGGMMKIARSGIFDPSFFLMPELLIIFAAAMFQDILLLDTYNTLGLPTSTTVSVVFGLFGGSLGITIIKLATDAIPGAGLMDYMNLDDVLKIVTGIFLSVAVAFLVGFLIQFLTRLIFTFRYKERFKKFGGLWGAVALSSISLFIIIKGLKNADTSFLAPETISYIKNNLAEMSLYLIIGWFVILQPLISFTKVSVLKIIVLAGTFSLAMAFAANDLVNFIGAPLAAINTYELAQTYGDLSADTLMGDLESKSQANKLYILIAGVIMMITLFVSKKARSVTDTTIGLSSQEAGKEKFRSNMVGRFIVRKTLALTQLLDRAVPSSSRLRRGYQASFDVDGYLSESDAENDKPAFDLIRAAVILMVSAGLISIATTFTLPLSTTYVTFIVAMAAALPDKAWGRETAAYRVSGVINVVSGWFATALVAMFVAGIIAVAIYYGNIFALAFFVLLTAGVLVSSTIRHRRNAKQQEYSHRAGANRQALVANSKNDPLPGLVSRFVYETESVLEEIIESFGEYDQYLASRTVTRAENLKSELDSVIYECVKRSRMERELIEEKFENDNDDDEILEKGPIGNYLEIMDSCTLIFKGVSRLAVDVRDHLTNSHTGLHQYQIDFLYGMQKKVGIYMKRVGDSLREDSQPDPKEFLALKKEHNVSLLSAKCEIILDEDGFGERHRRDMVYTELLSNMGIAVTECHQLVKYIARVKKRSLLPDDISSSFGLPQ